ncbi:uncharacterized PPE family protein PPE40-like [Musca domestica]|uniref:Uncharacterized PPE family protein PPE40-like n=1 Tax=Musca domestica TaxID=7370 RepID=A0ABM3VA71_MUSDO|nr:uncharacterized PPE family protein PPE40-like [Musca domestica]
MRAFIVLCFLATAYAASFGYDYERQGSTSFGSSVNGGFVGNSGFSSGGIGDYNVAPGAFGNNGFGRNGFVGNGLGNTGFTGNSFGGNGFVSNGGSGFTAPTELTKEFYTFTAPEGAFNDNTGADQLGGSVKRGVRVIFIKGPENNGLDDAALQLAKSVNEQKTAIYVLTKQADIGNLANKLNNLIHSSESRPEVHFVKYRTPADAENAQRTIQSQYESLAGKSANYNVGIAPVLKFASSGNQYQVAEPSNTYLPANKRF